jgi:formylglycine-generating enzyme required for sulfatase activity
MAGGSLEARLQSKGALPVEEAVGIAAQVCEGLACAHERGVVHCDLKPGNILLDARGRAKVADFGIAHISGDVLTRTWQTQGGFVAGTLPYMSPEQARGVRDDARVDVYALGAILYRMLTGRTYLDFDTDETPAAQSENVQRIFKVPPQPPSRLKPGLPAWLDAVVLRALAKEPAERYANAAGLRAALLGGDGGGRTVAADPAGESAPVLPVRRAARLPGWAWGAAAVLLLAAGLALGLGLRGRSVPTATPEVVVMVVTATALPATDTREPSSPTLVPPTWTPVPPTATSVPPTPAPGIGTTRVREETDGAEMVYVPAGEFLMGSTEADSDAYGDEKPQHTVNLDAFWIDRTEVTNAQFRRCVEAGACRAPTACDWGEPTYNDAGKADHPVVCVDWEQANAYCRWAGARLPTEAEWEKAARGTGGRVYPWGNDFDCRKGNFDDEQELDDDVVPGGPNCDGYLRTAPVGSYPAGASPYGALDMAGNVWEWAADWYDAGYYANSPAANPKGPDSGESRVLRGGSWGTNWSYVRAAYRNDYDPTNRAANLGLRCAASPGG